MRENGELNGGGDGPDEGAQAQARLRLVEGSQALQQGVDARVVDHGQHRFGQRGPGVGAQMRLAAVGAAPLHSAEGRVAATLTGVQNFDYMFVVGLVVGNEYGFHLVSFCLRSLR